MLEVVPAGSEFCGFNRKGFIQLNLVTGDFEAILKLLVVADSLSV